ncbi:MAG: formylglycine-generating enzyme family protein [Polyangiaceae bacterium]|nr:formylglycine-generating enzyme family protein [Polyangiaceae bacterium]
MGAPESEFGYTKSQNQVTVTLTRPFALQQYELTQEQWIQFGWQNPSGLIQNGTGDCMEPACPVGQTTWFEAAAYANKLSETHTPPLPACYVLERCTGEVGEGMSCESVSLTTSSIYECLGFRLATEAEWEFAARAGTTTAFYSGPITVQDSIGGCFPEPVLDPIAWYCDNSGKFTHPVGQKTPNALEFYDMAGNQYEWLHSEYHASGYGDVPLTDPFGEMSANSDRIIKGGGWNYGAILCRVAAHHHADWWAKGPGIRLARTLGPNEEW